MDKITKAAAWLDRRTGGGRSRTRREQIWAEVMSRMDTWDDKHPGGLISRWYQEHVS